MKTRLCIYRRYQFSTYHPYLSSTSRRFRSEFPAGSNQTADPGQEHERAHYDANDARQKRIPQNVPFQYDLQGRLLRLVKTFGQEIPIENQSIDGSGEQRSTDEEKKDAQEDEKTSRAF